MVRYLILGTWIGLATWFIGIYYFCFGLTDDGHSLIKFKHLRNWS